MNGLKLNIGCGAKPEAGWMNIDKYSSGQEDLLGDVCEGIDLPDGCAAEIRLDNVIEHLESIPKAMAELFRLLGPEGRVTIITPHYSSLASWRDPTHLHHLSYFSLDYFCTDKQKNYTGDFEFRMESRKLSFGGGIMGLIGRAIFKMSPDKWERKWSFLFRGSTLTFVLVKHS